MKRFGSSLGRRNMTDYENGSKFHYEESEIQRRFNFSRVRSKLNQNSGGIMRVQ